MAIDWKETFNLKANATAKCIYSIVDLQCTTKKTEYVYPDG